MPEQSLEALRAAARGSGENPTQQRPSLWMLFRIGNCAQQIPSDVAARNNGSQRRHRRGVLSPKASQSLWVLRRGTARSGSKRKTPESLAAQTPWFWFRSDPCGCRRLCLTRRDASHCPAGNRDHGLLPLILGQVLHKGLKSLLKFGILVQLTHNGCVDFFLAVEFVYLAQH